MSRWLGKKVVLGVSGSIAAYKSIYLLRLLTQAGAEVAPILTRAATRFVGPMTFSALAGRAAVTDLWTPATQGEVGHVELAHWADLVAIAPASADTLARIAAGRADDPMSAVALSTEAPLVFAPAMEDNMWHHPETQAHVRALRERGAEFVAPESGELASGRSGAGRLAEPETILDVLESQLAGGTLAGRRVLVTAGPTREHADPVRFLSNPSSGRMGFALARETALRGAEVTLVSGPVALNTPYGTRRVDVVSTGDMLAACEAALESCDAWIMAAAPSDAAPVAPAQHKVKKDQLSSELALRSTPDILRTLDGRSRGVLVVGFAAETERVEEHARGKLRAKNLDAIVANRVGGEGSGFAAETNAGTLIPRKGEPLPLPLATKLQMATVVVDWIEANLSSR